MEILEELIGETIVDIDLFSNEEITIYTENNTYVISGSRLEVTKEEN